MGILIDASSRVVVQGITGHDGGFHTGLMLDYGTQVVAGVTPGKGGQLFEHGEHRIPVYNTMAEAVEQTSADVSCIFVPPVAAADACMEAADAGIEVIVSITEGIPVADALKQYNFIQRYGATLIGPNCPGVVTVGACKVGIMPARIFSPGPVGLISRSGTLTYEVVNALTQAGLGQTTCIGIGGDPIIGSSFLDLLMEFEQDDATECVVIIGEIGGSDEELAAEYVPEMSKPVVGFISGRTAPPGKRMGHAGAIVSGNTGTADSKVAAFKEAGIPLAELTLEIPELVRKALG
ncbi:MAG: succinate--CoA ligase subunit alpha [bacterium]|nr:succinate--CoA ligase subunit alpha [bacterium]